MDKLVITVGYSLLAYMLIIGLAACICFFIDGRNVFRLPNKLVKPWGGDWLNFLLFIWGILFLFVFGNKLLADGLKAAFPAMVDSWRMVFAGLGMQLGMLAFIACAFFKFPLVYARHLNTDTKTPLQAIKQGCFYFFTGMPIIWVSIFVWGFVLEYAKRFGLAIEIKKQYIVELFTKSDSLSFTVFVVIMAAFLAPVVEELIFRGGIYRFLKSKFPLSIAMICSALLFSGAHFHLSSFLPLFIIGLLLVKAYERSGHLLTSITFHCLFNLNTLIIIKLAPDLLFQEQALGSLLK